MCPGYCNRQEKDEKCHSKPTVRHFFPLFAHDSTTRPRDPNQRAELIGDTPLSLPNHEPRDSVSAAMPLNHKDSPAPSLTGELTVPGQYPRVRMRRNRSHGWVRRLVAESRLDPSDFIWPVFVQDGAPGRQPIAAMPGVDRLSIEALVEAAGEAAELGVPAIALFPFVPPELKTADGAEACR